MQKKQIPIFHYEAGNRCNDERVPEEINRKIIDHISDVNFTYSEAAKYNLIKEGLQLKIHFQSEVLFAKYTMQIKLKFKNQIF